MIRQGFVERNLRWIFPLPAVVFVLVLMVFPVCYTFFMSFTDWSLTSGRSMKFTGFGSYVAILREPRFLQALGRTFIFTFSAVLSETILGIALALILNRSFAGKKCG